MPSGFVISCVPSFTFGMLFFTFFSVVGAFSPFVPLGPFTDVTTSVPGTSSPLPSGFVLKIGCPWASFLLVGYTCVPSAFVYTTGVTALFVDV